MYCEEAGEFIVLFFHDVCCVAGVFSCAPEDSEFEVGLGVELFEVGGFCLWLGEFLDCFVCVGSVLCCFFWAPGCFFVEVEVCLCDFSEDVFSCVVFYF